MDPTIYGLPPGTDLCTIPGATPPEGQVPNFIDPPSLTPTLFAISLILCPTAVVLTVGRLIANRKMWKAADYSSMVSVTLLVGMIGLELGVDGYHDYARHQHDIPFCWLNAAYIRLSYAAYVVLSALACSSAKISILLLYQQLFTITSLRMRLAIYLAFLLNFATYFPPLVYATLWMGIGRESDIDSLISLQRDDAPEKLVKAGFVIAAMVILLDVYIFLLPWPVIGSLESLKREEKRRERVKVYAVFGTAAMGIVAGIVSCVYKVRQGQGGEGGDLTWSAAGVVICVSVEANIAVIVASVPGFSKFLRFHVAPWLPVRRILEKLGVEVHSNDPNVRRTGMGRPVVGKESWLFKSGKSGSNNWETTREEHQERVEQELKSRGVLEVKRPEGQRVGETTENLKDEHPQQHRDVDLEKGLGTGKQEERT